MRITGNYEFFRAINQQTFNNFIDCLNHRPKRLNNLFGLFKYPTKCEVTAFIEIMIDINYRKNAEHLLNILKNGSPADREDIIDISNSIKLNYDEYNGIAVTHQGHDTEVASVIVGAVNILTVNSIWSLYHLSRKKGIKISDMKELVMRDKNMEMEVAN